MLGEALSDLAKLDLGGFLLLFWHAIIFEVPRFLLAAVFVGVKEAISPTHYGRPDPYLSVSLLLVGHNEGSGLRETVLGLKEQTRPDIQLVVVDDGSSDNMAEVGRQLKAEGLIDVFLATGLRGGKSAAANLGFTYCKGDVVVIADVDTSFDRDAVERIVEPFDDPSVGGVSGNIAVRNDKATLITKFQAIQYLVSISLGRRVTDMLGTLFIASGAFAGFRKEAIKSIGGWEVGPGEDADITVKLRQAGWTVRFQADAWALTDVPESAMALFRQRLRWNRSLVRVRVRKFAQLLNPARPNFSFINAVGTLDILWFQAVLPASFFVYLIWLIATFGAFALYIIATVTVFYAVFSTIAFLIACGISGHHAKLRLLPYTIGYAVFNAYVLRANTVYSYLNELIFRRSYRDSYVPRRVLDRVEHF